MTRRSLIAATALGIVSGQRLVMGAEQDADQAHRNDAFQEPAKAVPLIEDADVIVCGAGPAGISAAITAARTGAKVRLFETNGCLGGVWTAGLLTYVFDFDKPGISGLSHFLTPCQAARAKASSMVSRISSLIGP